MCLLIIISPVSVTHTQHGNEEGTVCRQEPTSFFHSQYEEINRAIQQLGKQYCVTAYSYHKFQTESSSELEDMLLPKADQLHQLFKPLLINDVLLLRLKRGVEGQL